MKKHLFLVAALVASMAVSADVIVDETFDYDVDTLCAGGTGWTSSGVLTTGERRAILATPLVYTQSDKEYILSGVGKAVQNVYSAGTNYIAYKQLSAINSGVVYLSYLYKGDGDQGQSQSEIIGLSDRNNQSAVKAWAGKQSNKTKNPFRLGVTRVSTTGSDIQWCDNPLINANTVTLVVLKYDFSTQTASLFINPEIGTTVEPTPDVSDADKGTAVSSLGYLMFKHNGSSAANFTVGGVRVSTTWAEAVAKKGELIKLDTPEVGIVSDIEGDKFTAHWTTVENASGYKVKVYYGENAISEDVVDGQDLSSAIISNMPVATELTYTVTAVGDGVDYKNSDESSASAAFSTTSNPIDSIVFLPSDAIWTFTDMYPNPSAYIDANGVLGYDFTQVYLQVSSKSGYTARAVLSGTSGIITLPAVASASKIKVYAHAGTDTKAIKIEQYNYGTEEWEQLGEDFPLSKSDITEVIATPKSGIAKLRVANADGSSKYIWKIETIPAPDDPTAIDEVNAGVKARKVIKDGQMLIERNGELYNMTGAKVL